MVLRMDFAVKPTLAGDLVLLRPVSAADAAGLFACDDETLRLTGSHQKAAGLREVEQWYATRGARADRLDLSIIERATGEWAGEVVLNELSTENESCGFRILLQGPRFYGRGLGTQASLLVLDYAFGMVGVNRVELQVDNFGDWQASKEWMRTSPDFHANPIGVFVDPARIAEAAASGEPFPKIHGRAMAGELGPPQPPINMPAED